MSAHDPFDGVYDEPTPETKTEKIEPKEIEAEKPVEKAEKPVDTVYSMPFLRRQSKGDLQKIARDKGLNAAGGRDDLVERIEADQRS